MADVNRSLAGTATGAVTSGNPVGSPVANINDDNILTSFGAFEHVRIEICGWSVFAWSLLTLYIIISHREKIGPP